MAFETRRQVTSPTGATLKLYLQQAEGRARAAVQINHGLGEHAGRYARLAEFLAARGFHSYAHDHRGHGLTTAQDAPAGRFAARGGGRKVLADVAAIHSVIRNDHPGLPVVIFGHSMGGLIALNYVLRHPETVHAAAIWNANFSAGMAGRAARAVLAWERFRMGSDVPSRLLPRLTFQSWDRQIEDGRSPNAWLSRDEGEVRAFNEDPLCGRDPTISLWQDVVEFVFYGADDANFSRVPRDLPIGLVGGEKDPATSGGAAVEHLATRLRRMGFLNLVSRIYPETRHESLNELNRDTIMQDFAAWLDATVAT